MLRFTLDTNCIIDLEENRPDSEYLNQIIEESRNGNVEIAVVAVSASENQPGGEINRSYSHFEEKLLSAGLSNATELLPLAIWDVFYWDHALWSDEEMEKLSNDIRDVLFPGIALSPPTGEKDERIWRNKLCDVLVAWCCIFHGWDMLVTRDNNFHKRKDALTRLGMKNVLLPKEAAELCRP